MRVLDLIPAGLLFTGTALAQITPAAPAAQVAPAAAQSAAPVAASSAPTMTARSATATAPAQAVPAAAGAATAAPNETKPVTAPEAEATAPNTAAKPAHKGGGFKARFEAANSSNDGKLTKDQAKSGHLPGIFKNFDAIDADHKGYVTLEDIKSYRAAHVHKKPASVATPTPAAPTTN